MIKHCILSAFLHFCPKLWSDGQKRCVVTEVGKDELGAVSHCSHFFSIAHIFCSGTPIPTVGNGKSLHFWPKLT